MRTTVALFLLLQAFSGGLAACGTDRRGLGDEPAPAPAAPAVTNRFAGTWLIEETVAHATYFATLYRFDADGTVLLVEDRSFGGGLYPAVTWNGSAYIECGFGERWSSADERLLVIDTACSDGVSRQLQLTFPADASANSLGTVPERLAVDGESEMWAAPVWGWSFFACLPDLSNCTTWTP